MNISSSDLDTHENCSALVGQDNQSLCSTEPAYTHHVSYNWPVLFLFIIVFMAIGGNIMVCLAVLYERKLRNMFNYFLVSLATSDMLSATLVMPVTIIKAFFVGNLQVPHLMCTVWYALDVLFTSSTIIHLTMISVDRYIALQFPLKYGANKRTKHTALKIAIVWILAFCVAGPLFLLSMFDIKDNVNYKGCGPESPLFVITATVLSFYLPLLIMTIMYILTVLALHRQGKHQKQLQKRHTKRKHNNNQGSHNNTDISMYQKTTTHSCSSAPGSPSHPGDSKRNGNTETTYLCSISSNTSLHELPTTVFSHNEGHTAPHSAIKIFNEEDQQCANSSINNTAGRGCEDNLSPESCIAPLLPNKQGQQRPTSLQHKHDNYERDNLQLRKTAFLSTTVASNPNNNTQTSIKSNGAVIRTGENLRSSSNCKLEIPEPIGGSCSTSLYGESLSNSSDTPPNETADEQTQKTKPTVTLPQQQSQGQITIKVSQSFGNKLKSKLSHHKKRSKSTRKGYSSVEKSRKAVQVLGVLFAVFLICYFPFFLTYLIKGTCVTNCPFHISDNLLTVFEWMGYSGSMLNPIIYHIFNQEFRKSFYRLMKCKPRRR